MRPVILPLATSAIAERRIFSSRKGSSNWLERYAQYFAGDGRFLMDCAAEMQFSRQTRYRENRIEYQPYLVQTWSNVGSLRTQSTNAGYSTIRHPSSVPAHVAQGELAHPTMTPVRIPLGAVPCPDEQCPAASLRTLWSGGQPQGLRLRPRVNFDPKDLLG
jgi:hypothetical protein